MKIIIALAVLLSANVHAINANEFVNRLQNTHPFFKQLALSTKIIQIDKRATNANQDWVLAISADHQREDLSDVSSSTYNRLDTNSIALSAKRKLINSGSDITFKHTLTDRSRDINTVGNTFSIDYTYPLLENKNGINDRLATDLATFDVQIDILDSVEKQEDFIQEQLKRFIDLAYAQQQRHINNQRLDLAKQELQLVQKKFKAFVVEKVDVLLQEDAYQGAKQQQLQAQQDLNLLRQEIALILNIDVQDAVAEFNLYQLHAVQEIDIGSYLLNNARLLKITDLQHQALKRQLQSNKNKSKVQLDLNLGVDSRGENTRFSNTIENQSPSWRIGLNLNYPIGETKNSTDVERTLTQITNLDAQKQEQLLDLSTQATVLRKKLDSLVQMLKSSELQIKIAKARTIEEKNRYSNGNSQASFVISAQNNEQNVKLNYAQIARDYQQSVVDFKAAIDKLAQ